ncbi:MAG: sulfotransferase [Hyphomonadaceae bacterium]
MAGFADVGPLLQAAGQKLAAGDHGGAEADLRAVLRVAPQVAEAHFMLGVIAQMRGEHRAAVQAFDAAINVRPGFGQAMAQKARSLEALDRREEAVKLAEAADRLAPDPYSQDTIGVVMTRAGLHAKAAEHYGRAARSGAAPGYIYNHAATLQFLGRFDEAREQYRKVLARDPQHGPSWAGLVQITKQRKEQNEIARLSMIASKSEGDAQAMYVLGHALAKAYDDIGDYAHAVEWLEKAKLRLRVRYDAAGEAAMFAAAERSVAAKATGFAEARPIFVVGMPRTGTTLVERILSSHSEVESAGELSDFPYALKAATGVNADRLISAELIDAGMTADLARVGRDYAARVKGTMGFAGRFVDKLPVNALLAPLILQALPEARVVMLRRHPADVVVSSYRQDFAQAGRMLDYTLSLEATAEHVVQFDRMAKVFADTLASDRYCEVRYEDVVGDLEGQVRRLLDFCGLGFEDACVRFEENASPVATASAAQVRQKIYASSVARWKKYRPGIDVALRRLVEAGVMSEAELG